MAAGSFCRSTSTGGGRHERAAAAQLGRTVAERRDAQISDTLVRSRGRSRGRSRARRQRRLRTGGTLGQGDQSQATHLTIVAAGSQTPARSSSRASAARCAPAIIDSATVLVAATERSPAPIGSTNSDAGRGRVFVIDDRQCERRIYAICVVDDIRTEPD
jgi:hypothetical protein